MFNSTQLILIIVVVVLSVLLSLIGIQVFFILKEVQKSVQKANKMLDDTGVITESISKPIASLSNSLTSLSSITGLFGWLANRRKKKVEKEEEK